jgi:histone acetyltransferase (RNA polymerase elongator complex component)
MMSLDTRTRPFIIPIFLPHAGCPHRCVFCNQASITGAGQGAAEANQIRCRIHEFLNYKTQRRKPVQISFFGGNFLGLKTDEIQDLLALAAEFVHRGDADSLRFSTRPDTIDRERLEIIADYPVATVELGVQSMIDPVLALARRGHNAADTVQAVERLKARHYSIGLQMMVGLPGDDESLSLETARKIADLQPDFVRIYPTVVVKNSRLARWYSNGTYTPLSLDAAVTQVKNLYLYFKKNNIQIIRMGLQASADLADGSTVLAGPYHPSFGHMVYSEIFWDAACTAVKTANPAGPNISIFVNPRRISIMRGLNNSNVARLRRRFGLDQIDIIPDIRIDEDSLKLENGSSVSCFTFGAE